MKSSIDTIFEDCGCIGGTIVIGIVLLIGLALLFGVFCLEGWIFMLLWNWLAVSLFGANPVGFWVCVGLVFFINFIGKLLFGRTKVTINKN